ncbi:restriction endonuclease subunit S [Klebsiella pneumoniae]|uniref:Restriction endonuclease subunit S n=1 Tax=Klebsiella pneumoniae TaxID=573 RepID=A0A6B2IWF5_KLEPN|nr:restriction endonuclease subunit S [Klebsiella pneumoniae]EIW8489837.1 restriction endonuclease subunit S [Klebsiella pneumoniae]EKX9394685.1 restriction endonuclease subunit S [Klebsiella pneumoniae]ELA2691859.1 restriction endonuclease subunit S [Klebsiella pneumoniae]EWE11738.1 type-1 restriction enzyme EcoprrI specificity protein [Klebsiella pneumoniae BIDMC 46b]NDR62695.1 restriction endonuclease subunit S [Klebsiella pneumoniae]
MSELNFLGKLLDGIEIKWLPIGDIAEIYGGLTGKTKADFEKGNAKYISYKTIFGSLNINNIPNDYVDVREGERQNNVRYGDVLFTGSSEIAEEAGMSSAVTSQFDEPVYLNSFSFGVRFNDDIKIKPEFSKYLFRTSMMRTEIAKTASGVTRFNISKARFKKVLIPVPCPDDQEKSLSIQSEIVRILDTFTALTAELTAELTMRKKQYNYYRDQLLSFKEGEVEWKTLGEVATFRRGTAITQKQTTPGDIPVVANGPTPTYFHSESNRQDETIVIARSGAYAGYVSFWNQPIFLTDAFSVHPNLKIVKPKFLYYVLQNKQEHIHAMKKGAGVPHVRVKEFESYDVPIPPLAEQVRIVTILDKFDTLTNSITEGLPREIELRQKQYEYYRDMLFSFPKPDVVEA